MTESIPPPCDWFRVRAVFDEALARPLGERPSFVRKTCDGNTTLEAEVLSLLQAEEGSEEFLQALSEAVSDPSAGDGGVDRWAGAHLAGYEILERIGRGGMSSVYRARHRDGGEPEFVALKMLDVSIGSPVALQRFAIEQEGLSRLDHPGIVTLLEGGTTDDGTHWFTMDLVEGQSICRWADQQRLGLKERILLVLSVGEIVSHAHARGILHRDLKPSNILVTAQGNPMLLDFGIAKLLDEEGGGEPSELTMESRAFTLKYASPEQMAGEPVSEASDVFSLGALLCHLLVGAPPPLRLGVAVPTDPSRLLEAVRQDPTAVADARGTDVDALLRDLGGSLTRILGRACNWKVKERYPTVEALSDDLREFR